MMNIDPLARYSKTQEWVRKDGNLIVYGITHHAQEELSDIVFIELPEIGASFIQGDTIGTIESVKAASDLILPMSGTVVEINESLGSQPEVIDLLRGILSWVVMISTSA